MKENLKEKVLIGMLCFALVMPLIPAGAQEDDEDSVESYSSAAVETSSGVEAVSSTETSNDAETGSGAETKSNTAAKPANNTGKTTSSKPATKSLPSLKSLPNAKNAKGLLAQIIGYVSKIGAIFGKATGMRIGGTSGTAIITLVLAKILEDKAPSWVKYALYAGGGTMIAGGSANIVQALMGFVG